MNDEMYPKKISINWKNDEIISIEVNGVEYDNLEQISDPDEKAQVMSLISNRSEIELDTSLLEEDFDLDPNFKIDLLNQELNPSIQVPKIIFFVFLPIAVLLLSITGILTVNIKRQLDKEKSTSGQVVEIIYRQEIDSNCRTVTYYFPVVEFYDTAQKYHRVQLAEGSSPASYEKGEQVTVLYDPERPINARIKSVSSNILMWLAPSITGFIGVTFLIITSVIGWISFKPNSTKLENLKS